MTRCCARSSRRSRRSAVRSRCCGPSARPRHCGSPGSSCCRRSGWARSCSTGEGARLLLAGNAAHADAPVDAPVSGAYGWLLAMLGQQHGFPVPVGGSGELAAALGRRAQAAGAALHCDQPVDRIDVRRGRAVAVHTAAGLTVRARRAVIADVNAPALYRDLLPADAVPARLRSDLDQFDVGHPRRQGQLGARRPDPLARAGRRGPPGPCTWARTSSGSSGGRPTWSRGRCRRRPSCCSGR